MVGANYIITKIPHPLGTGRLPSFPFLAGAQVGIAMSEGKLNFDLHHPLKLEKIANLPSIKTTVLLYTSRTRQKQTQTPTLPQQVLGDDIDASKVDQGGK